MSLFYCPECNHIYYKIPDNGRCLICGVEISEEYKVHDQSYLVCETCYTLYSPQRMEEIIPTDNDRNLEKAANYLCKCKHHCPPNTVFQKTTKDMEIYLEGSIVLGEIFQCQNCKAVYIWNSERRDRRCLECGADLVIPLEFDPETHKEIFRCANPNHGIRLNKRDLILNHNEEIENNLIKKGIVKREQLLREEYLKKEQTIKNSKSLIKREKKIQEELARLKAWAKKERQKIYSGLESRALNCAVYRVEKKGDKKEFVKTNDGCGALANIKIRKIVKADTQHTLFGKAPSKQAESTPQENEIIPAEQQQLASNLGESVMDFGNIEGSTPISPSEQDIAQAQTYIVREEEQTEQMPELKYELNIKDEFEDFLKAVKIDGEKGLNFIIEFFDGNSLKPYPDLKGILPIIIKNPKNPFAIGKSELLKAYWLYESKIEEIIHTFDNMDEYQFQVEKKERGWEINIPATAVNKEVFKIEIEDPEKELQLYKDKIEPIESMSLSLEYPGQNIILLKAFNFLHPYYIGLIPYWKEEIFVKD